MPTSTPPRVPALLLLSVALSTHLQAQLAAKPSPAVPSTPTTESFPNNSGTQPAVPRPQHRAHITFANGLLTVSASNASLNGLIRDIAHQTGMKVTGSVAEDRVFGEYGPADPQTVLASLLDGTGSNILIRSNASDAPVDLILTPRIGAPSPPSPTANVADTDDSDDPAPPPSAISARYGRPAVPPSNPAPPPPPANPSNAISPASQTVVFPPADSTSTPSTATTTPADTSSPADSSSDTVKTPQQIFEQLQKLRQQTTSGTPSPSTPAPQ